MWRWISMLFINWGFSSNVGEEEIIAGLTSVILWILNKGKITPYTLVLYCIDFFSTCFKMFALTPLYGCRCSLGIDFIIPYKSWKQKSRIYFYVPNLTKRINKRKRYMHPIFNFKHFRGDKCYFPWKFFTSNVCIVFIHYNTVVVLILRSLITTFGLACKFDT